MIGYVYLRLAYAMVRAVFGTRVSEIEEITTKIRIFPNDLDANLHLNNGRYLTLMDIGRFDLVARSNILKVIMKRRWYPVLGGAVIRYRKPIGCFDLVHLKTRILWWDEKWLYMEQRFEVKGTVCARGMIRAVFKEGRRVIPTRELLSTFGLGAVTQGEKPEFVDHWEKADSGLRMSEGL